MSSSMGRIVPYITENINVWNHQPGMLSYVVGCPCMLSYVKKDENLHFLK